MARFMKELNGSLGAFWQKEAEKELAKIKAELDAKKITIDDLLLADLANLTISDNRRPLFRNKTHFVDGFLGADFVDNTDKGISNGDEHKKKIFVATNKKDHGGKGKVDKIKDSESVFKDDFADGVRLFPRGAIDAALADFGGNLCI